MIGPERGPRPPSRRSVEDRLDEHLHALTAAPTSLDPHNRAPFRTYLAAHRAWRAAALRGGPDGGGPAVGLLLVVAVTLLGDIGTLFVSISVVLNASVPAALAVAVALGTAAMFLAHQVGHWLHARQHGRPRVPGALTALCALAWLGIGAVAALLRLAAPLNTAGGFGTGRTNAAAIAVVLAALLFVLYTGNGLAAATLGHRTGDQRSAAALRTRRRREIAAAREGAWLDALEADAALRLAAVHGSPMTTDVLTTPWPQEIPS